MQSKKTTCVAVLRAAIGLSVEQFADLIGKSTSTINSLETGRLALSEETAERIEYKTGVSIQWLLGGNPTEKPYRINHGNQRDEWKKSLFELIQSDNVPSDLKPPRPAWRLAHAITFVSDWLSVYSAAEKRGEGQLAAYLMTRFLKTLTERLGKDDAAFLEANREARLITQDNKEWEFIFDQYVGQIRLTRRTTGRA